MNLAPTDARLRLALLALFALSGFSGLAYESVWSHYLKLMLGHAAYAQTLVLVVYMGGMSLGAWAASRSARWRDPLKAYALVEGAIGVSALLFHPLFVATDGWLHTALLPLLGAGATGDGGLLAVDLVRWGVGAALMLPQAILLGMTFPLMSAAVLRLDRERFGGSIASLYFTNCAGAALGVLITVFVLVPSLGLPGTLLVAGLLNLLVAGAAWLAGAGARREPVAASAPQAGSSAPRLLLIAAAVTGLASFIYEIAWIRMLSLVLGSTMQSFELMLAAFLLGLALGGLWVRRRARDDQDPVRLAGMVQVAMGCFAVLTLPVYGASFGWMQALLASLAKSDGGYTLFLAGSHGLALAVMLPATVMAGMTLPLFTTAALRAGSGEAGIGRIYALNTLGCILGALLAVHLLLPWIGTHGAVLLGAAADVGLGLALLATRRRDGAPVRELALAGALGVAVLGAVLLLYRPDPLALASGVFRTGQARQPAGTEVLSHRDGRTATVTVLREVDGAIAILTNGKTDASFAPGVADPGADSVTMVLSGALPLALRPQARTAVNIGIGSGITTHTLLGARHLEAVDTVEIEREMVAGARLFGPASERAFSDPRSRIHIEDAKAWLAVRGERYDLIVSEPSNPWISGVASLFSREFYARIKPRLAPGGVLVQWLQLYSSDPQLVASVLAALGREFADYAVYATDDLNILIVASDSPLGALDAAVFDEPALAALLAPIGVSSIGDLEVRLVGRAARLRPLVAALGAPVNSDYFPFLSINAPKAQYLVHDASELTALRLQPFPLVGWLAGAPPRADWVPGVPRYLRAASAARTAHELARALETRTAPAPHLVTDLRHRWAAELVLRACEPGVGQFDMDAALDQLADVLNPWLAPSRLAPLWDGLVPERCRARWPESSRDEYALYRAIGAWDLELAQRIAEHMLPQASGSPAAAARLAGIALTARVARGDQAAEAWNVYGAKVAAVNGWPLHLVWLGALALDGSTATPGRTVN